MLPIYYDLLIIMFVKFFFRVRRLKFTLDVFFCIRFMIGSYYIILTVVLIMSLLYAAQFFVSVWSGISGGFHSGSDFWHGVSSRFWFDDVRCCGCVFVTFV